MSDYAKLKKLDEESLQKLKEGPGPADECLCSIFSPEIEKKSLAASVKKALGFSGKRKDSPRFSPFSGKRDSPRFSPSGGKGGNYVDVPLTFSKDGKGEMFLFSLIIHNSVFIFKQLPPRLNI